MGLGYLRKTALRRRPSQLERAACALLAAVVLATLPAQARAQVASDSEIVDARGVILEQGTMAKVTDLNFGDIAMPGTAGTVSLTPAASAVCTPSFGLVRTGPCVAAQFAVFGRKNWLVRIRNMSGTPIVLTGPGGATMNVTLNHAVGDMVAEPGGPSPPGHLGRYRINSDSGLASFWVGGTLSVANGQASGVYTGTVTIQVLFQ
jgi:hypothetical protein